jgi:hypothetical protein
VESLLTTTTSALWDIFRVLRACPLVCRALPRLKLVRLVVAWLVHSTIVAMALAPQL